jgi:hypothetical protein
VRVLERALQEKANWSEVEASLQARATIQDVNQSLAGIAGVLNDKASASELRKAVDERAMRAEVGESQAASARRLAALEQECAELRAELREVRQECATKQDRDGASASFASKADVALTSRVKEELERLGTVAATREDLEAAVRAMATREEVQQALQTRAGVAEVERALAAKADTDRMMSALGERPTRIEMNDAVASRLLEARTQLSAATAQQVAQLVAARRTGLGASGLAGMDHPESTFLGASGAMASAAGIRDLIGLLDQKANATDVEVLLASKVGRNELSEAIATRASTRDMEARVAAASEAIAVEVQSALLQSQKEVVAVLNKKAYKADVHRSLKTKADAQGTAEAMARKPDALEVREALSQKVDKASCQRALAAKADAAAVARLEDQLRSLASNVARGVGVSGDDMHKFRRELLAAVDAKADGKHVAALCDQKVDVADMNAALGKLSEAINANTRAAGLPTSEQAAANEQLSGELQLVHKRLNAELMCGRWIWKSGTTAGAPAAGVAQPGELVPWNIECANANPSMFRWAADAAAVGCEQPGLYEVRVGMFTDKQPRVSVMVNGHCVFTTPTGEQMGPGGSKE